MKILPCIFSIRFIFFTLLLGICETASFAQSLSQNEELVEKASQLIYSNPDEAIKIAGHLLKNCSNASEKAAMNFLLAESYEVKGNYNNAINAVFEAGKYAKTIEYTFQVKVLLLKSALLRELYLDSQSEKYLHDAEAIVRELKPKESKPLYETRILLNKIEMNLKRQNTEKAQELIHQNTLLMQELSINHPEINQGFNLAKGRILGNLSKEDSAKVYFGKALQYSINRKHPDILEKATILYELGKLHFQEKQHQKSIEMLLKSLGEARIIANIPLLKLINRQLAINYLALNDKVNYQFYSNEFLKLNNTLEQSEQESVNNAFNLISQEQEHYFSEEEKNHAANFYMVLGFAIVVILICLGFWLKVSWKKKRLKEIINYLEIGNNIFSKNTVEHKEPNKKISIPVETEQAILAKLKRFESTTKFTNNEMSLAVLAGQFETNTKYLSEIINKHYQDNFNTYINKLRINFIIQKLKTDPNYMHYKISYLAEKSGFSSHSSFATVFKSITGIAPVTFIELLKKETEQKEKE